MRFWMLLTVLMLAAPHTVAGAAPADSQPIGPQAVAPTPFPPFAPPASFRGLSDSAIEARLIAEHPIAFFVYASELLDAKRLDEAMFWYSVGMIRYQFYGNAYMKRPSEQETAMLAPLRAKLVAQLEAYNQQDFARGARQLTRALDWDLAHENGFTSKTEHADVYPIVRSGYEKLRQLLLESAKRQRKDRSALAPGSA
jgi:hypothetical protein